MSTPLDRRFLLGGLAGAAGVSALSSMARGGPLNPPAGAVASTSKPLGELEPRVAINSTNTPAGGGAVYRITQPGSYYLTGHLAFGAGTMGILVLASDVSIDLNGFTIAGATGSGSGVSVSTSTFNFALRNGLIRNCGLNGVDASATPSVRIEDLTVVGCAGFGIVVGDNSVVSNCLCTANASGLVGGGGPSTTADGISVGSGSLVRSCAVRFAGRYCINHAGLGLVTDCHVSNAEQAGGVGIQAVQRTLVRGCQVSFCTIGIRANGSSRVESCHVNNCVQVGILSDAGGVTKIIDNDVANVGSSAGHAAIRVTAGNGCTIERNRLEFNYRHIEVLGASHFVVRNSMAYTGAGGAMNIAAGNAFGPVIIVGGAGSIAGIPNSDHPQANFVY